MHIKDHSAAMKFFRTYDSAASKGKWKEFVDEMEFDSMAQEPRTMAADGGRIGLQGGTNVRTRQGFQPKNPGNIQSLKKKNIEAGKTRSAKLERAKVLLKEGKSKAKATKIIVEEFKLTRHPYAGTAPWMKDAANELITEGYEIVPGKQDTGGKKRAATKRQRAIGKGPGPEGDPTRFEWRMKKIKTKSGIGKIYETAHTANIFQAKKLGIDYPIDALQLQKKGINQEVAEILDGELKPLYKKQYDLVNKLKKNPTPALRKSLDQINYQIAELVSSGGTQGEKAVNVLRAIQVDPYTLKGRVAELGYDFSKAIDTGMTGGTTKTAQLGTEADVIAKANFEQLLKDKGGFQKLFKGIPCIKGVGGDCTTPADFRKGFNQLVKEAADGKGSAEAIQKLKGFTKAMRGIGSVAKWTGYGLLAEAGFMVPFAVGDYAAGKSWKRILGNATDYGFGPILGQSEFEEFEAALPEGSLAVEGEKVLELGERLSGMGEQKVNPGYGRVGFKEKAPEQRYKVYTDILEDYNLNLQPFMKGPAGQFVDESIWNQAHQDAADARAQIAKENFEREQKRDLTLEVDYFGAATGGIASLKKKW